MIKPEELRIGNYLIHDKQGLIQALGISPHCDDYMIRIKDTWVYLSKCNPIPLTEQWLIDFGFVGNDQGLFDKYTGHLNFCQFTVYASKTGMVLRQPVSIKVYHVHQLQNLYFAIKGEELKRKEVGNG